MREEKIEFLTEYARSENVSEERIKKIETWSDYDLMRASEQYFVFWKLI